MKIQSEKLNGNRFRSLCDLETVTRSGILLCALLVIAYCIWTLDRGFDITDEAYYLLMAMHPGSVKLYLSAQHWITGGLWQITGSITTFRAAGMFLLLASAAVLAAGVLSASLRAGLMADSIGSKVVVHAGSAVGALLYASTINLSPCYNLVASAGANAAAGLVLLATCRSNNWHKYVLFSLAGCAVGAEALCKASSGIATLALLFIWVAAFERSRFGKILGPAAMVFGVVAFAGVAFLGNTTISDLVPALDGGMQLFRLVQFEAIGARLVRYSVQFAFYAQIALVAFGLPIVAAIGYTIKRRAIFAKIGIGWLAITLIFGGLDDFGRPTFSLDNAISEGFLFAGMDMYGVQMIAIFAMLVMALIVSKAVWSKSRAAFALFAGLILLPYTVAVGTGNPLFTQIVASLAPWGVLVVLLAVAQHSDDSHKMPSALIGICFTATIALQIVTSGFRPYHLPLSLTKHDQTAIVGNLGTVKVDDGTYKFLAEMRAAIKECDIAPGAPFLGLYNIPGVALTLQAIPVLTPWLGNKAQAELVIGRLRPEEIESAVVALQVRNNGTHPALPQQLAAFPAGFRYCGVATYPYRQQRIQIWQSDAITLS